MPLAPHTVSSLDSVVAPGADALLSHAFDHGLLNNIAVGILREDSAYLHFVGPQIAPTSQFQLASVTKTYTAELLALLAAQGIVHLNDPVAKFLPTDSRAHGTTDPITLSELATHTSGLPRLPAGLPPTLDPYAGYTKPDLEHTLEKLTLQRPTIPKYAYSNLGYTLLGHCLAQAAGTPYAQLLHQHFLHPLGMTSTALTLTGQTPTDLLTPHAQSGWPTSVWHFDICAPCGGLCSTAQDQLRWAEFVLRDPDRLTFQPRAAAPGGGQIGLGWHLRAQNETGGDIAWHNGATFGFSSHVSIHRHQRWAVVILTDRFAVPLVQAIAHQLEAGLSGRPITPLTGDYGKRRALPLEGLRHAIQPLAPVLGLPAWARYPVMGSLAFGAESLLRWLAHR